MNARRGSSSGSLASSALAACRYFRYWQASAARAVSCVQQDSSVVVQRAADPVRVAHRLVTLPVHEHGPTVLQHAIGAGIDVLLASGEQAGTAGRARRWRQGWPG